MSRVNCEGWWEQNGYGRQPMSDLWLEFDGKDVSGAGFDVVGQFTFSGALENEKVVLLKHYTGKHSVEYAGTYDGEGLLQGLWQIGIPGGQWLIRIASRADDAAASEIQEIVPTKSS